MTAAKTAIAVVVLTVVALGAGIWIGDGLHKAPSQDAADVHKILHHELGLSADQEKKIEALESKFALDRKTLDVQMHAANLELAGALESERVYGDAAKTAVSHFHQAMAKLQELTIVHILDMRAVLTPEQAVKFDKTVRQALSADPP